MQPLIDWPSLVGNVAVVRSVHGTFVGEVVSVGGGWLGMTTIKFPIRTEDVILAQALRFTPRCYGQCEVCGGMLKDDGRCWRAEFVVEETVGATTVWGEWSACGGGQRMPIDTVVAILDSDDEWSQDFDCDGIAREWVEAIDNNLPEGVTLHGQQFFGPWPVDPSVKLSELVDEVDFWAIADRHQLGKEEERWHR